MSARFCMDHAQVLRNMASDRACVLDSEDICQQGHGALGAAMRTCYV